MESREPAGELKSKDAGRGRKKRGRPEGRKAYKDESQAKLLKENMAILLARDKGKYDKSDLANDLLHYAKLPTNEKEIDRFADLIRKIISKEYPQTPDASFLPGIVQSAKDRLNLSLQVGDLFRENFKRRLDEKSDILYQGAATDTSDVIIRLLDANRYTDKHNHVFERWIKTLVQGEELQPLNLQIVEPKEGKDIFHELLTGKGDDPHQPMDRVKTTPILLFEFPTSQFQDSAAYCCKSMKETEEKFHHLPERYADLRRVLIAPQIGQINPKVDPDTKPVPDIQCLKITMLTSFAREFLRHTMERRKAEQFGNVLGISGGFHLQQLLQNLTEDDIRRIDGAVPLYAMPTETINLKSKFGLGSDIMEPRALRGSTLVKDLELFAHRTGHPEFRAYDVVWYSDDEVPREKLRSMHTLQYFIKDKKTKFEKDDAAAIEKFNDTERYFMALNSATIFVISLGDVPDKKNEPHVAGNFLFRYLDVEGNLCSGSRGEASKVVFSPSLDWFKERVKNHDVVVLATGNVKIEILTAVIKAGLCNTVIMDESLANDLYMKLMK